MKRLIIITLLFSFSAAGRAAEDEYLFVVRKGDTARSVTERYLVRPTAWERVVQYNYILKPGNLIRVPGELVDNEGKAVIFSVSGDVRVRAEGRSEWFKAINGLILGRGDMIRTGADSGAVLKMGRDDEAVLRSGTEVVFEPYEGLLGGKANRITVNSGTVLASTRKRGERESRFEIRTPDSELDLIGTTIRVKVNSAGQSQFEVLQGETVVKSGGKSEIVGGERGMVVGDEIEK